MGLMLVQYDPSPRAQHGPQNVSSQANGSGRFRLSGVHSNHLSYRPGGMNVAGHVVVGYSRLGKSLKSGTLQKSNSSSSSTLLARHSARASPPSAGNIPLGDRLATRRM